MSQARSHSMNLVNFCVSFLKSKSRNFKMLKSAKNVRKPYD